MLLAPAILQGHAKPKTTFVKKFTVLLLLSAITYSFNSCTKTPSCTPVEPSAEATTILSFATANGIDVQPHPSGIYYEIIDPGTGVAPDNASKITVTYETYYLDGSPAGVKVDEELTPNDPPMALTQFIEGWQIILPMLQEGGTVKMIVPSSLAFGCQSHNGLPGNAILYYQIHLISVS